MALYAFVFIEKTSKGMWFCQRCRCRVVLTIIHITIFRTKYIALLVIVRGSICVCFVVAKERHLLSCRNINSLTCIWCYRLRSISANPVCHVARSFILESNSTAGNRLKCQWSRIYVRINRFFAFFTRVGVWIFISSSCIIRYCPSIWNT